MTSTSDQGPPPLVGRHYFLRPLSPEDYPVLRSLELAADSIHFYRHRSGTPSPEAFVAGLWQGVQVHFAVCTRTTGEPVGSAVCYNTDFRCGTAYISVFMAAEHRGPASFESLQLFIDYVFASFPLRKLYADVLAPNLAHMASYPDYLFEQEARFVEDVWVLGEWVDRLVLALWRTRWIELVGTESPQRMGSQLATGLLAFGEAIATGGSGEGA